MTDIIEIVLPHWYRDRIQAMYGIPIAEWERRTGRKLKDDSYKRQLPTKQTATPTTSPKQPPSEA